MPCFYLGKWAMHDLGPSTTAAHDEAIEWLPVARLSEVEVLCISACILEHLPYHQTRRAVAWSDSDARRWLNTAFLRYAFTPKERQHLVLTSRPGGVDAAGAATTAGATDTVFLLSADEVRACLSVDTARGKTTLYAKERGCEKWWWLRSIEPSVQGKFANALGEVNEEGLLVEGEFVGMRPAIVVRETPELAALDLPACDLAVCDVRTVAFPAYPAEDPLAAMERQLGEKAYSRMEDALHDGNAVAALRLMNAGDSVASLVEARRVLAGGYAAWCATADLPDLDARTANNLFKCMATTPAVAHLIVRTMDLDAFANKESLMVELAGNGFVALLRLLEGHDGYFTMDAIDRALAAANAQRRTEAVAYLLNKREELQITQQKEFFQTAPDLAI